MINQYLLVFLKYTLFYFYFYLVGSSLLSVFSKFFNKNTLDNKVLYLKINYLYPLVGFVFLSNLLFLINIFIKLDSKFVTLVILLTITPALKNILLKINLIYDDGFFKKIFNYVLIPGILLISTFDINFNYDAGYYHLLHQSWLRESNLVIGMSNIFWALGISSIYEYISSIMWFDTSFVFLHFINIFFIHFFYIFISENLINKEKYLYNTSLFILVFSLFDNFGLGGGRNGFIYIQGLTKQDVTLGILYFYLFIVLTMKIKSKKINDLEIVLISLFSLFVFQIKISGFLILVFYFAFLIYLLKNKLINFRTVFKLNIPFLGLSFLWTLKSFFTTGCLVFPVSFTCFNVFSWYQLGSTEAYQSVTTQASLNYEVGQSFVRWIIDTGTFEYRNQIFLNYLITMIILIILKKLFFEKEKLSFELKIIFLFFIILNIVFLLFYGPIPRYAIGISMISVGYFGFSTSRIKFKISNAIIYFLIFSSIFLVVRADSYIALLNNNDFRFFDPRTNSKINEIGFEVKNEDWVGPLDGDQCWTNTRCTPNKANIKLEKNNYFYIAYSG